MVYLFHGKSYENGWFRGTSTTISANLHLLLFHFNTLQSQVKVKKRCVSMRGSSSYKMYDAFCGTYQKKLWYVYVFILYIFIYIYICILYIFMCIYIYILLMIYIYILLIHALCMWLIQIWRIPMLLAFRAQTPSEEHLRVVGCERPSTPNCKCGSTGEIMPDIVTKDQ